MKSARAFATILLIGIIALLGASTYGAIHFGLFSGESKRAKVNTQTTQALVSAETASGASAAAYTATMASVAATLPESNEKAFLVKAGAVALSYLPPPDPQKLLEAEKLKTAFLTGQLELANSLTASALNDSAAMQKKLTQAIAAKRASDVAIQQAADKDAANDADKFLLVCIAVAAGLLYLWTKASHISPLTLSRAVADIKNGTVETNPAVAALDGALTPFQQLNTKFMVWLRSKFAKVTS